MSFTVAILLFYDSAVGSKELENDQVVLLEMTRLVKSVPARALSFTKLSPVFTVAVCLQHLTTPVV